MPTYQLLRCEVALAGDREQVVSRHRGRPLVYPELHILEHLHGEGAVSDVAVVGVWDASNDMVLERLRTLYADRAIKDVFPGVRPKLPVGDPSLPLCDRPVYVAPPTRPDNPDPKIASLAQFTLPEEMPRVVQDHSSVMRANPDTLSPPVSQAPPVSQDTDPAPASDPSDDDLPEDRELTEAEIQRHAALMFGEAMAESTLVDILPKPDMPDAAASRARHNIRGEGTKAPRTADHLPDVAGGNLRPMEAKQVLAKARGRG